MTDAAQALTANQEAGIRERLEKAREEVNELCHTGRHHWHMSIPVQETDSDVILSKSLNDVERLLIEVLRLRQREIDLCTALDVEGACPDDCIGKVRR